MSFEWYKDFIQTNYTPSKTDLIMLYKVKPAEGFTFKDAVGRIASESSVGTWTTLYTITENVRKIMARAYKLEPPYAWIAYSIDLFEKGSIPQLISSIAGNIFGMKAVENVKLLDLKLPKEYLESFNGPQYGLNGVKKLLEIHDRPILATVPKPKVGLTPEETGKISYEALIGGIDLIKDDENLTSLSFNKFDARLKQVMKAIEKAENETGEKKGYLINITGETEEMKKRLKLVSDYGNKFIMIDILTAGWAALQTIRKTAQDYKLAIHAHRAFHAAFTRSHNHGMSMKVIARLSRTIGVDHLHIGTVVGKLVSPQEEVVSLRDTLTKLNEEDSNEKPSLGMNWGSIKPVAPVSSGGLHPGLLPEVMRILGTNIIIQVGGGIWGHPDGGEAGAKAVRQAVEAYQNSISLEEYAEKHRELKRALEKWGYIKPK